VFAGSILNYPDPLPASMKVISLFACLFVLGFSTSSHILYSKFKLQTKHFNSENWIFNWVCVRIYIYIFIYLFIFNFILLDFDFFNPTHSCGAPLVWTTGGAAPMGLGIWHPGLRIHSFQSFGQSLGFVFHRQLIIK